MRLIDADVLEKTITNDLKGLSEYEAKLFMDFMCYVDEAPTITPCEDIITEIKQKIEKDPYLNKPYLRSRNEGFMESLEIIERYMKRHDK